MDKAQLIEKTNTILNRIEAIDKERKTLLQELVDFFPVKKDDKVRIMKDDKLVRFAYVNKIEVKLRGPEQKAAIEFDLQKCKKDGTIGSHADYLGYGEYIKQLE